MSEGFGGEIADLYERYRHGYPPEIVAAMGEVLGLGTGDLAVDLGCGTGQLTLPLAARLRAVIGIDPEPDMLAVARFAAERSGVRNASWMLGSDRDIPALGRALGDRSIGAITVGQALHWMNHRALFKQARELLRAGGGIAILTNGTPLWLQNSDWSSALRAFLERWLDCELTAHCGTDEDSQRRYREDLADAGYRVRSASADWIAELNFDRLLGGILSAMGEDRLPAGELRAAFAVGVRQAVGSSERFLEPVHVELLTGRIQ